VVVALRLLRGEHQRKEGVVRALEAPDGAVSLGLALRGLLRRLHGVAGQQRGVDLHATASLPNDLVSDRLAPGVRDELERLTPRDAKAGNAAPGRLVGSTAGTIGAGRAPRSGPIQRRRRVPSSVAPIASSRAVDGSGMTVLA